MTKACKDFPDYSESEDDELEAPKNRASTGNNLAKAVQIDTGPTVEARKDMLLAGERWCSEATARREAAVAKANKAAAKAVSTGEQRQATTNERVEAQPDAALAEPLAPAARRVLRDARDAEEDDRREDDRSTSPSKTS